MSAHPPYFPGCLRSRRHAAPSAAPCRPVRYDRHAGQPVRPATSSARSPSATRAGSPAPVTARRSTAGGTGASNWGQPPSPSNTTIVQLAGHARLHARPTRPRTRTSATASRRQLFSSYDQQTVDTHFQWMQQNGCDTAALQRFNPIGGEGPTRDAMAVKVRAGRRAATAASSTSCTTSPSWTNMQSEIKTDWTDEDVGVHRRRRRTRGRTASRSSASGASASTTPAGRSRPRLPRRRQLVQGPGLLRHRRRADVLAAGHRRLAARLPRRLPRVQHDLAVDGRPDPATSAGADHYYNNVNLPDQADCNAHGIDYQPCVMPGDLSVRAPPARRLHVAAVLQPDPGRRAGHLHLDVRRVQRGQPDRQDRRDARPGCRPARASARWTRTARPARRTTTCGSPPTAAGCSRGSSPLTATRPTQPMPNQGAGGVIFYEHVDYGGAAGQRACQGQLHSRAAGGGRRTGQLGVVGPGSGGVVGDDLCRGQLRRSELDADGGHGELRCAGAERERPSDVVPDPVNCCLLRVVPADIRGRSRGVRSCRWRG